MTHTKDTVPANPAQGISEALVKNLREGGHLSSDGTMCHAPTRAIIEALTAAIGAGGPTISEFLRFVKHTITIMRECGTWDAATMQRVEENVGGLIDQYLEAAIAAAPAGGEWREPDRWRSKLNLWFFRDLSDEQRLKLFSLFELPVAEIGKVHSFQRKALDRCLPAPPVKEGRS